MKRIMAKQLNRSAVRIYGALSALGQSNGNVLESLLPFFDPVLRQHNGGKLDPDLIAAAIRETYKWNFNTDLVETFTPLLVRQGWLVADIPGGKDTTYTITLSDNPDADASTETVEIELRRIATQFKEFSEALSPLTTIPRDVEEFEDILVEWLLYVEAFSERNVEYKAGVRPDAAGKMRHSVEVPSSTSLRDEEKFLCARFVKDAIENDQSSSVVLSRIAAIGLLTEVVQDFVKPVTSIDRTDLIVYLDAPVAMELLGLSGKLAAENTAPIINELIRIGASIRIFGQSLDEIKNSLQAVLKNPRPTGPTAQALLRNEVLREYVVEASKNPSKLLEEIGVKVAYRTREQHPSAHQYFTKQNWQDLYAKVSYAENPVAREHDADITTFVARQRLGRTSQDIFKSHAIAVTRNGLLAQIVRRTHVEMTGAHEQTVPPVIHRRVLATALWLRTGMGAGDLNIPKRMLMATCEHVLAIRPGVVEAVKRLTDAMGDDEKSRQLDLLVSQDRSAQALMDKTLGISNVVTEENFSLLWEEMLHPHLEEERQKGLAAVSKAKSEGKRRLAEANQTIESIRTQKQQEMAFANERLAATQREDREAIEALCADVERNLRNKRRVRVGIGVFLGLAFAGPLLMDTTPAVQWTLFAIGALLGYLTATGGRLVGVEITESAALASLQKVAKHRRLAGKLEQFFVRWQGIKFAIEEKPEQVGIERSSLFDLGASDR